MTNRWRHGYACAPRIDTSRVELEVSKVARSLLHTWNAGRRPKDSTVSIDLASTAPNAAVGAEMKKVLGAEAGLLGVTREDQGKLVEDAVQFVEWARSCSKVANTRAIARFAVWAAYEATQQHILSAVITDQYPRRWKTEVKSAPGGLVRELGFDARADGLRLAFGGRGELEILEGATAPFVVDKAGAVNIHSAYLGMKARWGWALDPIRPPMSAVRFTASVIHKYKGSGASNVLAIEPGLTAAVQAIAWFLPNVTVHMCSAVLGDENVLLAKADAVILNLANARSMALVKSAVDGCPRRTLNRDAIDQHWNHPATDAGNHCEALVQVAFDHLADDGLLVVLGDVDSGIHHRAVAMLDRQPDLDPVKLTPTGCLVHFGYAKAPWAPYGGLPATDRFVSAWMKVIP